MLASPFIILITFIQIRPCYKTILILPLRDHMRLLKSHKLRVRKKHICLSPCFAFHYLCDKGQLTYPLSASVSVAANGDKNSNFNISGGLNETIDEKVFSTYQVVKCQFREREAKGSSINWLLERQNFQKQR